ncbi:MAG: flagellum-specific ATP synthase FliI [Spirochaetes bacterium]|nr:MAG: flagellum-specific ATP synthase FliI [Spirochaetota bacterium]
MKKGGEVERFRKYYTAIEQIDPIKYTGVVVQIKGLIIESHGPRARVGELCQIVVSRGEGVIWAEVVGITRDSVQLMPYDDMTGIEPGCMVIASGETLNIPVSEKLLGRVLGSMGRPIDGKGNIPSEQWRPVFNEPAHVLKRARITRRIVTGIRSIDFLVPVAQGQRIGIFSGSGVGKTTLLGMIARNTNADINVLALIGERGREVREFLENDLGEEGLKRSVVVVSSSNKPPLSRIRGAYVATAIAEYFRDMGKNVMLLFDSVTRFARAQREIGLAIGEPPATRGFTPSVFSILPKLLERCGTSENGTITGFYSVLVEGDDIDEPISDAVRGVLDGHIILSRRLANQHRYPAVDVLQSVSRLAPVISGRKTKDVAAYFRRLMAVYAESEDLIDIGAYAEGSNPEIDEAIRKMPEIRAFLQQEIEEKAEITETFEWAAKIAETTIPQEEIGVEEIQVQA